MEKTKLDLNFNLLNDEELKEFTKELIMLDMIPIRLYISKSVLENPAMTSVVMNPDGTPTEFLSITFAYPQESSNVMLLADEGDKDEELTVVTNKAIEFMKLTSCDLDEEDTEGFPELDDEFIN